MVLINSEKHNKCEFAASNSDKHNGSVRSIFQILTQTNVTEATAKASQCVSKEKSKELPKELLSTARLTTHLLPTKVENIADSSSNRTKNSLECYNVAAAIINKCCDSNCPTSCEISFDCKKRKMKQKHQLQLQPLPQLLQLYKSLKASATTATNVESIFSPSFKFRHRRNKKCETLIKPVDSSSILKVININYPQQHQSSVALTATTKSIPLMAAAAANSKVATKKSTFKKRKSLPSVAIRSLRFRPLSGLKLTSLFSLLTFVCLETVLLSTVSNCAKTFYMHWNTSNSIFRIDNTDHIIDVNKGNLAFEFDQVHIICPVYEPGTFENETEKYIIYNVSKVEYETCRITNADPRVIAICDKPQKLMFFTITFRPFTPQPGGLEFLPGNDYYFISTSSKDDLYRRIGGRCSTNNMKVVFKVCCSPEDKNNKTSGTSGGRNTGGGTSGTTTGSSSSTGVIDSINSVGANGSGDMNVATGSGTVNQQHINSITRGIVPLGGGIININNGMNGGVQPKPSSISGAGTSGTSINTNIDQFNRIPMQTNSFNGGIGNGISTIGLGSHGSNGILLTPSVSMVPGAGGIGMNGQYPGHQQTGIRINNVPSQQHPTHKNNNDDHFNKHPNEVVKNEELTYNSAGSLHRRCRSKISLHLYKTAFVDTILSSFTSIFNMKNSNVKHENNKFTVLDVLLLKCRLLILCNINPIILVSVLLVLLSTSLFKFQIRTRSEKSFCKSTKIIRKLSLRKSEKSSYLPILSSNCSPSLKKKILKEICTNINTTASISYAESKNVKCHKHPRPHDLKNTYRR